jgi:hypothetical protein
MSGQMARMVERRGVRNKEKEKETVSPPSLSVVISQLL